MKRYLLVAILAAALAACLASCGKRETAGERAARQGILLVGTGAEPESLDPHIITGSPEFRLSMALFEGLLDVDPKTMKPVPAVAESWSVSPDQLTYTFILRPNAKWSNGEPLTARDFVYSWRRALSPNLASGYAYLLFCVRNAERFNKGEIKDFAEVGCKATDDHTLVVTLAAPTPHFLGMLNLPCWFPVHKATVEKFGAMDERGTKWTRPGNMVSNGPFVLDAWEPDKIIRVSKSPTYWDAASVRLKAIHFFPVVSVQTEERMFRSGELHVTENMPVNRIAVYEANKDPRLRIEPYLGTYFYRFNVTRAPFKDARVRRAFAMSVDRDAIVKHVTKGGQRPAATYVPPDTAGYGCNASIPYDVAQAKKLIAEAGFPEGKGLPPVELLYNTNENHKAIAEAIQQMWQKNLGVSVRLVNQDWKVYSDSVARLDYSIARGSWISDYIDPISFLECFTSKSGNNRSGYASPRYDDLIARGMRTPNEPARYGLYCDAEKTLLADAPLIPIYFYTRVYLLSPIVKGWEPNLVGFVFYKRIYFEGGE